MATSSPAPGHFLCGCSPADKAHYRETRIEHGLVVCPEHGEPMYGYMSPQVDKPGLGNQIDYSKIGTGHTVRWPEGLVDRRDNRDPQQMHRQRELEKTQRSNGHA